MSKKALLMILDGWGIGDQGKDDVIFNTPTPYWDSLLATYPHSELQASGENVGLPDGQMGNSEVGHLNIGAGRIVYQDLVKINRACADGSILKNKEIVSAFSYAKEHGKNIHFMGLTSNGGVHSSFDHLFKLCDISKEYGIENTFIHCFMDGRDTDPKSGKGFIEQLTAHCEKSAGKIASIVGRFYAMDRDKRWERVKVAYDLLVNGEGKVASDMVQAMQDACDRHGAELKYTTSRSYNPYKVTPEDKVCQLLEKGYKALGCDIHYVRSGGGCDSNIHNEHGIQSVGIGIGMEKAHTGQENIPVEQLNKTALLVLELMKA